MSSLTTRPSVNHDTTVEIWEHLYMVRVPSLDATSVQFIKAHGTYITGNKEIDNAAANDWITTYMPIAKMVELYKEGVTIAVVKYDDTKKIYEAIERHLTAWLQQLNHGLNIGNAPIEDLLEMDKFANTVYAHARHIITEEAVKDLFHMSIHKKFKAIPGRIIPNFDEQPSDKPKQAGDRESMAEFLKSRITGIKRF